MDHDIVVKVENLSKNFRLPHEKRTSVKSLFVNLFRRQGYENLNVLRDISFEIKKGEFFGIVGRNGSGKSTLLKLLAGIYYPEQGQIQIKGKLVPFIELGVGFNPELTGRENVFLNGALLGLNRKEVLAMYDEIVDFAELEQFMDQKLKNYSSGMQVRLAFSIAIRAQADVLLLDEVLAVGDSAFQQKCFDYFSSLKREKRTIILVSHNMAAVEQFCDRAILIEKGDIKHIGPSSTVAEMYEDMFLREEAERLRQERVENSSKKPLAYDSEGHVFSVSSIKTFQRGKATRNIDADKDFVIEVKLHSKVDMEGINIGINIKNHDRVMIFSTDNYARIGTIDLKKNKTTTIRYKVENILNNGVYTINLGIAEHTEEIPKILLRQEKAQEFTVSGVLSHTKSLTHPKIEIETG